MSAAVRRVPPTAGSTKQKAKAPTATVAKPSVESDQYDSDSSTSSTSSSSLVGDSAETFAPISAASVTAPKGIKVRVFVCYVCACVC